MSRVPASPHEEGDRLSARRALARLLALSERSGWLDACRAASISFVSLLVVGSVLATAVKLHSPSIGAGAPRWYVLTAVVLLGLGCLGTPVALDGLSLWALPLGSLAAVGATLAWATARLLGRRRGCASRSTGEAAAGGARTAVPFALLACAAALVFRLDAGPRVGAHAGAAAALAALWGALFGALGGLSAAGRLRSALRPVAGAFGLWSASVRRGLQAATAMTLLVSAAGAAGATLWLLVVVVARLAGDWDVGDAVAALVAFLAFFPNATLALAVIALGAPLEVSAGLPGAGGVAGPPRELSLLDGTLPWYLSTLLVVPPVASFLSGAAARRDAGGRAHGFVVLGVAALGFSAALTVGGALAGVRVRSLDGALGAGVTPDVEGAAALALVWGAVLGAAGWLSGQGGRVVPGDGPGRGG